MNPLRPFLIGLVRVYGAVISPVLTAVFGPMGFGCRFQPTCSEYALEALRRHGAARGSGLTLRRLCRCHPWGGSGFDPVPAPGHPPLKTLPLSPPSANRCSHGS